MAGPRSSACLALLMVACAHAFAPLPLAGQTPARSRATFRSAVCKEAAPSDAERTALVVGAGPAGLLLALRLGRLGIPVEVYEAAPAPTEADMKGGPRSYQITLGDTGRAALSRAGLEERFKPYVTRGLTVSWPRDGPSREFEMGGAKGRLLVPREGIVRELHSAILDEGLPVTAHWGQRLVSLELPPGGGVRAEFEALDKAEAVYTEDNFRIDHPSAFTPGAATGARTEARGACVIGCDGKHSRVRGALAGHFGRVEVRHEPTWYRTLARVPFGEGAGGLWRTDAYQALQSAEQGFYSIYNPHHVDGAWRGAAAVPDSVARRHPELLSTDPDDAPAVSALLTSLYSPDLAGAGLWGEGLVREMLRIRPRRAEWISVESFCSMRGAPVALLGDAAHQMIASMGLGCNTALASASLLGDMVEADAAGGAWRDIPATFARFDREQRPAAARAQEVSAGASRGVQRGPLRPGEGFVPEGLLVADRP